jgi:glycosyltransferase involved in cell wall biosynthesis
MRILNLIHFLSGGGAERQLCYLAPELVRIGHDIHIAYINDGPDKPTLSCVALHKLKSYSNYDPRQIAQIIWLIKHVKPDIIQTWIQQMDILGGLAAKLCDTPLIFREPTSGLDYTQMWKNYLRVKVGSAANAVISNSQGGDEYWRKIIPDQRRHIISNALPIDEIEKTKASLPKEMTKSKEPIALFVGRMVKESKRPDLFLEALDFVGNKKKISGVLCGEGPQRSELEMFRYKHRLPVYVHFTGYLPVTAIWAIMKKASVFVSLSSYEGCPNAVMEAMVCGCPMVISDIPAHRELLDESCALFVNPSNARQTADAIIQILDDSEAARNRALIAKQKTIDWSITEMARNYEKVYKKCI